MTRLATVLLVALSPVVAGCVSPDGVSPWRRCLDWIEGKPHLPSYSPAHIATSARVEEIGRKIIAQNTFTGIEPQFITHGVSETALFHRGPEELHISEGLVNLCKTDAQLAAVLCSELGKMSAEKRNASRTAPARDSIPDSALPGGTSIAGGVGDNTVRDAERAFRERQRTTSAAAGQSDPRKLARDFMKGAGFDPEELDKVVPLLKQSSRGDAIQKQMLGPSSAPW